MTIDQCKWPILQHISCPGANASTGELHLLFKVEEPELALASAYPLVLRWELAWVWNSA